MVEDILKLDFNIAGVVMSSISVPTYGKIEDAIKTRVEDTKKIILLDNHNEITSKDTSKLQLGTHLNDDVIVLYDFSKGLNEKELNYFRLLFKRIVNNYHKKIILVSKDINFLSTICDTFVIYGNKVVYSTKDIYDDFLYNYIDMPNIVKFVKISEKKGINLLHTNDINELIKDIYRRRNENKNNN